MKPSAIIAVLSIVLAVSIALNVKTFFIDDTVDEEGPNRTITTIENDTTLIKYFEKTMGIHPDTTGKFIPYYTGIINAHKYREQRKNDPALKKEPYGFAFGRNVLRTFLDKIDALNRNAKPEDSIQGVRIYFVRSQTEITKGVFKEHFDLMMVPAKGDGKNYIPIGDQKSADSVMAILKNKGIVFGDDILLNTSSPCPDMCDGTGGK
jgi:hypothetical protein